MSTKTSLPIKDMLKIDEFVNTIYSHASNEEKINNPNMKIDLEQLYIC